MKFRLAALFLLPLALWAFCLLRVQRDDTRTLNLSVPQMMDDRTVRIITNSVLDQLIGDDREPAHLCEIDLAQHRVIYHEGANLSRPDYHRHILACLAEVGLAARIVDLRHNPPALLPTRQGPQQTWPDRFTAILDVPSMRSVADANVVAQAISFARTGEDPAHLTVDRANKVLTVTYNGRQVGRINFEQAIACAGFAVNDQTARDRDDLTARLGWIEPQG
jgi:hypothetical protein